MKIHFRSFAILAMAFSLAFTACKKAEEVVNPDPTPTSGSSPSISFGDSYGTMAAVTSVSYTTIGGITVPVETNTAVAAFPSGSGSSAMVDAGTVTLNTKALTKQTNNSYVYQNLTDPLSLSQVAWSVSGSSAVPALNYTYTRPMPEYSGYSTIPSAITRSSGLTIQLGSMISGADSIYVIVTGGSGSSYLLKRLPGGASEAVFSSSELSGVTAGSTGMIQVVPWNFKAEDFSDKKMYFVNETAYSKIGVTIN